MFSHEVRSGLYGAADADGDGRVSYPEIAAFVARANAAIAAERFRPQVYARAPRDGDVLLDLRASRGSGLRLEGPTGAAHHLLEDAHGVRLLDFHGDRGHAGPAWFGPRATGRSTCAGWTTAPSASFPAPTASSRSTEIPVTPARSAGRGAAHEAFGKLFTLAFDADAVATWQRERADVEARAESQASARAARQRREQLRRAGGWTAIAVGGAAAIAGAAVEWSAYKLQADAPPGEDQRSAIARNDRIDTRNRVALGLSIASGAAIATGMLLLLWPRGAEPGFGLDVAVAPNQMEVGARWRF